MDIQTLIELLHDASAPTVLAILLAWALWSLQNVNRGRIEDLRAMTDVLKANAVQMERLTVVIERGQGAK